MYPPVMPSRALSPPWKPDSTGAPTAASRMKASTAMVPACPQQAHSQNEPHGLQGEGDGRWMESSRDTS